METDDDKCKLLLDELRSLQDFDQRIHRVRLLQHLSFASAVGRIEIAKSLAGLWEESFSSNISTLQWRNSLIQAARCQISHVSGGDGIPVQFLDLATQACEWGGKTVQIWDREGVLPDQKFDAACDALKSVASLATTVFTSSPLKINWTDDMAASSVEAFIKTSFSYIEIMSTRKNYVKMNHVEEDLRPLASDLIDSAQSWLSSIKLSLSPSGAALSASGGHANTTRVTRLSVLRVALDSMVLTANACAESGTPQILNALWKSVMLLVQPQEGIEAFGEVLDVSVIVMQLVLQGLQKLKAAVKSSLVHISKPLNIPDADNKEARLIRFFITHAVRIARWYPKESGKAHHTIARFATKLFSVLSVPDEYLNNNTKLKQTLCETVWPATCALLQFLLNTEDVDLDQKCQFLQCIVDGYSRTGAECNSEKAVTVLDQLFSDDDNRMSGVHGKVGCTGLFLNLLSVSYGYKTEVLLEVCRHLDWLLDTLSEEGVYGYMLQRQTFPKHVKETTYASSLQLTFVWALQALETFITVAASSGAMVAVEQFLFRNAIHPSALCFELIKNLWCFVVRNGDKALVSEHVSALFSILQAMCGSEAGRDSEIPVQRMARLICSLLAMASSSEAERIFSLACAKNAFKTLSSATLAHVLLQEGWSFGLLPDSRRTGAVVQLIETCLSTLREPAWDVGDEGDYTRIMLQIKAAASLFDVLRLCTEIGEQVDAKKKEIAEVCLNVVKTSWAQGGNGYRTESIALLSQILKIFQYVQQELSLGKITDLLKSAHQSIGCVVNQDVGTKLHLMLSVAEFLSSLWDVAFPDDTEDPATQALLKLYHFVLKEQHWAVLHSGLASFSTFAANTPMPELWRFVPPDASQPDVEDIFMKDVQTFLEKQLGRPYLDADSEARDTLRLECKRLRTSCSTRTYAYMGRTCELDHSDTVGMQIQQDGSKTDKNSHFSSEISKALVMLQEGTKLLEKTLPMWLSTKSVRHSDQHEWVVSQILEVQNRVGSLSRS